MPPFLHVVLIIAASLPGGAPSGGDDIPIKIGQTLRGKMSAGDPDSVRISHIYSAEETGPVTIEARSLDFDTGLMLFEAGADGIFVHVASDDDGRVGTDSRLVLDAVAGRRYRIVLHSVVEDWGGDFEISLHAGAQELLDANAQNEANWNYWAEVRSRAKQIGSLGREIRAIVGQGWVLKDRGSVPQAKGHFEEALSLSEKAFGPEHPTTATCLNALGDVLSDTGFFAEAKGMYERVLSIREKTLGPEHTEVAAALEGLALVLPPLGLNQQARQLLERALAIKEKYFGPDQPEVAGSLENLAYVLAEQLGVYEEALPLAERALRIREAYYGPDHTGVCLALRQLALVNARMGEYTKARAFAERSLAIQEKTLGPDHPALGESLNYLAVILGTMGYSEEARKLDERLMRITQKHRGEEAMASDLHNYASTLEDLGSYVEARTLYERALALEQKKGPDSPIVANTLISLGRLLGKIGSFEEARQMLEKARDIGASLGYDHPAFTRSLDSLAWLHERRGAYEEALPLAREALEIREKAFGPDHPSTAASLTTLARILWRTGAYAEAKPLAERALRIQEERHGAESAFAASALGNLVRILRDSGKPAEALPLASRAVAILDTQLGADHPRVADARRELALVEATTGDRRSAIADALRAEQIGREHLRLTVRSLPERESLRYASVRTTGLDLALALTGSGSSTGNDAAGMVWDALVRSRSLVVDEMASRNRTVAEASQISRLAERLATASSRLANLMVSRMERPAEQYRRLLDDARKEKEDAESALAMRSGAFGDQRERDRFGLKEALSRLPEGTAMVGYALYTLPKDLPAPRAGAGRQSYLAFVARSGGAPIDAVPLGDAGEIDALVSAWRLEAQAPMRGAGESDGALLAAYRRRGEALRRRIWDPIATHLGDARRVLLVPDGALNLVTFGALPDEASGYLIEQPRILHYLSAERDVAFLVQDQSPPGAGLLALGAPSFDETGLFAALTPGDNGQEVQVASFDGGENQITRRGALTSCDAFESLRFTPLPGTGLETEDLAGLWEKARLSQGDASRLIGVAASEASFKKEAPGRRILHLATHGFFLGAECHSALTSTRGIGGVAPMSEDPPILADGGENPLRLAGLALAGANHRADAGPDEEDGVLTAEEISAMDLSGVEWAVLSACDTGLGEIEAGEGVFGLRRAFRVAGARTLIMSLWPVEDRATHQWMKSLYEGRLLGRRETADAVRAASVDLLRSRRASGLSAHPFYWAAFVAVGDWR